METVGVLKSHLVRAADIRIGTQLAESDGFLWEVTEVFRNTETAIAVRLNCDFSSFRSH